MGFFPGAGAQCTIVLRGKVLDDHTNQPLPGATVAIVSAAKGDITDDGGNYLIRGLCEGVIRVRITHMSCDSIEVSLNLKTNANRNFLLHHQKVDLQGVTVQGRRVNATQVTEQISAPEVLASRGAGLAQVLQNVSGVTMLTTGSNIAKPVIHGLHSNRIVLMNNGVRLEGQQWGAEHAPEIDPYVAGKFTVLKGAAAVRYGADAIAGVVLVEPKALPSKPRLAGEVNTAFFTNNRMGVVSGILEQHIEQWSGLSYRIQGTLKRGGNMKAPDYWLMNTGTQEWNYSAAAGFVKDKWGVDGFFSSFNTNLGLYPGAHLETVDELNQAIKAGVPLPPYDNASFTYAIERPRQEVQHYTAKVKGYWKPGAGNRLTLTIAHQENKREEYDPRPFVELPEMSLALGTTSGELLYELTARQRHVWQTGINYMRQENVNGAISARQFIRNYKTWTAGVFSVWQYTGRRFDSEAGVRYDYKFFESFYRPAGSSTVTRHEREFSNASLSGGLAYRLAPWAKLKLNVASAWRPPAPNEMYAYGVHQGLAAFEIGNPDFAAERALNMNVNLHISIDTTFSLDITGYSNYIDNFIYLSPTPPPILTIRGYYPVFTYKQTNARLSGVDADMAWSFAKNWQWSTKLALLYARNTNANDWLIFMPANRLENYITYRLPSKASTKLQGTYLKAGIIAVAEQKRIPNEAVEADYAPPPDGYFLLNIDAATTLAKSGIELGITATNTANARYREYLNRLRYFTYEAGINIQFRVRVPFK